MLKLGMEIPEQPERETIRARQQLNRAVKCIVGFQSFQRRAIIPNPSNV
jgi:hypothetical protein